MTSGMTPGSITIPAAGAARAVVRPAPGWRRARPEASGLDLLAAVRTIPPSALAQGNQTATAHPAKPRILYQSSSQAEFQAYFDRGHQPVLMEFGPVLDLDDVLGGKVAALASRADERDYIDVAAALARGYSVAQLTGLAAALDPGLTAEDLAYAGQRLDRLGDDRFARYGLTPEDVTRLREQFAPWPRTPDAVPGVPGGGVADPAQGFPLGRDHPA